MDGRHFPSLQAMHRKKSSWCYRYSWPTMALVGERTRSTKTRHPRLRDELASRSRSRTDQLWDQKAPDISLLSRSPIWALGAFPTINWNPVWAFLSFRSSHPQSSTSCTDASNVCPNFILPGTRLHPVAPGWTGWARGSRGGGVGGDWDRGEALHNTFLSSLHIAPRNTPEENSMFKKKCIVWCNQETPFWVQSQKTELLIWKLLVDTRRQS